MLSLLYLRLRNYEHKFAWLRCGFCFIHLFVVYFTLNSYFSVLKLFKRNKIPCIPRWSANSHPCIPAFCMRIPYSSTLCSSTAALSSPRDFCLNAALGARAEIISTWQSSRKTVWSTSLSHFIRSENGARSLWQDRCLGIQSSLEYCTTVSISVPCKKIRHVISWKYHSRNTIIT